VSGDETEEAEGATLFRPTTLNENNARPAQGRNRARDATYQASGLTRSGMRRAPLPRKRERGGNIAIERLMPRVAFAMAQMLPEGMSLGKQCGWPKPPALTPVPPDGLGVTS
jgi:hypothetical protein